MQKVTPFLWFDKNCEEAMNFYVALFPNSKITSIKRYPSGITEGPMAGFDGKVLTGVFELMGQRFMALDGGPYFKFNPSVSLIVNCESKEEVDKIFGGLKEGGKVLMELQQYPFSEYYGWVEDKYGLSWQVAIGMGIAQRIVPSLLFVKDKAGKAEEAINLYTSVFHNSAINMIARYEKGEHDTEGFVKFASFKLDGFEMAAMDSSHPDHKFEAGAAVSLYVDCKDQAEVDEYWNKLSSNPAAEQCGWLQDKYGFSWQIIPEALPRLLNDPDQEKAGRAMQAMLQMKKIVVADLEKAFSGQ